MSYTNPYSPDLRLKYRPIAAQRFKDEYGLEWNALSKQEKNLYLTKLIVEELNLSSHYLNGNPFTLEEWNKYDRLARKHSKKEILRGWLGVIFGLAFLSFGMWEIVRCSDELMHYDNDKFVLPSPMINFFGFVLLVFGSIAVVVLAFYIVFAMANPEEFSRTMKSLWKEMWDIKHIVFTFIGGIIIVPFIIWWFCVDLTPWKIFIAPGMILALIAGKRR